MKLCQIDFWCILGLLQMSVVFCRMSLDAKVFIPKNQVPANTAGTDVGGQTLESFQTPQGPSVVEGAFKKPEAVAGTLGSHSIWNPSGLNPGAHVVPGQGAHVPPPNFNVDAKPFVPTKSAVEMQAAVVPKEEAGGAMEASAIFVSSSAVVSPRIGVSGRKAPPLISDPEIVSSNVDLGSIHQYAPPKSQEPGYPFVQNTAQFIEQRGTWKNPVFVNIKNLAGKDEVDVKLKGCLPTGYYTKNLGKKNQLENIPTAEFIVVKNHCYLNGIWRAKSNVDIDGFEMSKICAACPDLLRNLWLQNSVFLRFAQGFSFPKTVACNAIYEYVKHGFNRDGKRMKLSEYVSWVNEVYEEKWQGACADAVEPFSYGKSKVDIDDYT